MGVKPLYLCECEGSSLDQFFVAIVYDDENLCCSLCRLLRAAGLNPVAYPSAEAFLE